VTIHKAIDAELFVRENIGWMQLVAERLLKQRELAEDAVQDAFIAAFKNIEQFEQRSSLKTWLHRITVNAALTRLRRINKRAEQSIDELLPEFDHYECRNEYSWTFLTSIEEVLDSENLTERVKHYINELPDSYRIVLLLRDIEGFNTAEVAEQLSISEANVKVRLHRARAALKKLLEPILHGEPL